MGLEWLKPAAFLGSILFALMGVIIFWLCFVIIDKVKTWRWVWWWRPCVWASASSWQPPFMDSVGRLWL